MFLQRFVRFLSRPIISRLPVTQAPLIARLFQTKERQENKQKRLKLSSPTLLTTKNHTNVQTLTPLKSLGGLSFMSYMAIESLEGHFNMYKTWNVDLAKDLNNTLDRLEEMEIMVKDLTNFIELQKTKIAKQQNEIANLRASSSLAM